MMDLTENFIKLLQIAIIVVGVLSIYFSYINYNITVEARKGERDAIVLGNFLLSSNCLTYGDTKSLFAEDRLIILQGDATCIGSKYPFGGFIVELLDLSSKWQARMGPNDLGREAVFSVVVRMNSGEIKPATMVVKV